MAKKLINLWLDWWWALGSRFDALVCVAKGHDVQWRCNMEPEICGGDICCDTCNMMLWCRAHDPWPLRRS